MLLQSDHITVVAELLKLLQGEIITLEVELLRLLPGEYITLVCASCLGCYQKNI